MADDKIISIKPFLPLKIEDMYIGQRVSFRVDGGGSDFGHINGFALDGPIFLGDDGEQFALPYEHIEDGSIEVFTRDPRDKPNNQT